MEGYWINSTGKIIEIDEHPIKTVVAQPETFGFNLEEMQIIYAKYDNINDVDSEATNVVINDLLEKGWIYCHKRHPNSSWTIEVNKLDIISRKSIIPWIEQMLLQEKITVEDSVKFYRRRKELKSKRTVSQILLNDFFA